MPCGPVLICLAHGSRDPRHQATVEAIVSAVRTRRPRLDVRTAYLDHDLPRLPDAVAALGSDDASPCTAVAVPLLLGNAYHGRLDAPAALRAAVARHAGVQVELAPVLGPDPRLLAALTRRLAEAEASDADGLVVASAGTTDLGARAALENLADRLRRASGRPVTLGFAAGPGPRVGEAVADLRLRGSRRVAVAAWFLAPGLLYDRARADALDAGAGAVAAPLGACGEVADLIVARHRAALETSLSGVA